MKTLPELLKEIEDKKKAFILKMDKKINDIDKRIKENKNV